MLNNVLAIIDMGTNTFHLLIVQMTENGFRTLVKDRIPVKIGMGGINKDVITEEAMLRAMDAMLLFKSAIDTCGATQVFAFGTSALRNAVNAADVVQRIKDITGIEATIISGDQEAELIYRGVREALELGDEKSLTMDIGGGSVEFIIANQHEIFWKQSFEIGGQRLLEKFHTIDPIPLSEVGALHHHLEVSLASLWEALDLHQPQILVGSSGTFDTLSDIFCALHNLQKDEEDTETPLTLTGFHYIFKMLLSKNRTERLAIPGMIEMRVDMIVVSCCLIDHILSKYHFRKIRVSRYSLKEGILAWLNKREQVNG